MRLTIVFLSCFAGFLTACAGSSAPTDAAPASTVVASTAAPPAATPAANPAATPAAAADANLCVLGKAGTWSSCIGKRVEVRGKEPKMVYQHPMIAPMSAPGGPPTMQQSYLEVAEGSQIIVLSKTMPKCGEGKRVTGTLREINLGGAEGTKESYKGWSIDDATITCE